MNEVDFIANAIVVDGLQQTREAEPVSSPILNETIAAIAAILGRDLDAITVERAVVGLFFTGVKLTCGPVSPLAEAARRRATRCPAMSAAR